MTTLKEFEKWWESQYGEAMQIRDWQTCENLITAKGWQEDGFIKGYEKGRRDLIEAASDGLEEYCNENILRGVRKHERVFNRETGNYLNLNDCEKIWTTSKLSSAKKIEDLERENREMRKALDWATRIIPHYSELYSAGNHFTNRCKQIRQRFNLDKEEV